MPLPPAIPKNALLSYEDHVRGCAIGDNAALARNSIPVSVPQFTRDVTFRKFLQEPASRGEAVLEVRLAQIYCRQLHLAKTMARQSERQ